MPTRLELSRRAGGIAAAVAAELTVPFAIDLMFERFPQEDLAMLGLNGVLDAVAEVLRRLTIDPHGMADALASRVRGVQIHPVSGGEAGLRLEGDRLVLELRLDGAAIVPVWPDDLIEKMRAVLTS